MVLRSDVENSYIKMTRLRVGDVIPLKVKKMDRSQSSEWNSVSYFIQPSLRRRRGGHITIFA